MINWLLPVTAAILAVAAWDGHKKGLIRKLVGVVSLVLTLFLTSALNPFITEVLQIIGLDTTIQHSIAASDNELIQTMEVLGLGDAVSGYMAEEVLHVLAFLITMVLVGVLVRGIAFVMGIASKLPIIKGLNKTAGLVVGLAEGVVLIWVLFFVATVFSATAWGGAIMKMIAQSSLLSWLYRNNILFGLLA